MKKCIVLIFTVLFIFCIYNVHAESKSVEGKYKYQNNSSFYSGILNNNSVSINLNNLTFHITSSSSLDNGTEVLIVPVKKDAYEWVSSKITNMNSDFMSYYVIFQKSGVEVTPHGKIVLKSSFLQEYNKPMMKIIDTSGSELDRTSSVQNGFLSATIYSKIYVVIGEEKIIKHTLTVECGDNGSIVINGNVYSGNFVLQLENGSSHTLILKPNSEYQIEKVLYNNNDITQLVVSGFFDINDIKESGNIKVSYKQHLIRTEKEKKFIVVGRITEKGLPKQNIEIQLQSVLKTTTTDENGQFIFYDVESGSHSITALEGKKIIGYMALKLEDNSSEENTNLMVRNGITTISVKNEDTFLGISMNLSENYRININKIDSASSKEKLDIDLVEEKSFKDYLWILFAVCGCGILFLIIRLKRQK